MNWEDSMKNLVLVQCGAAVRKQISVGRHTSQEKIWNFFPELIVYHVPPFNESFKDGFHKAFKYGIGKGAFVSKWLFEKKKFKVIYELLEMITVPFIQSIQRIVHI